MSCRVVRCASNSISNTARNYSVSDMPGRRQYLYSDAPIPRRTKYRHRARDRLLGLTPVEGIVPQRKADSSQKICDNTPNPANNPEHASDDMEVGDPQDLNEEGTSATIRQELLRTDSGIAEISSSDVSASDQDFGESPAFSSTGSCDSYSEEEEQGNYNSEEDDSFVDGSGSEINVDDLPGRDPPEPETLLNTPLCASTTATEGDALLMCLALGLRHSLTWAAMVDILSMINCLFDCEVLKASKYFFFKYMDRSNDKIVFHMYCPYCERYLGTRENINDDHNFICSCGTELKNINQSSSYFLSLNIGSQLKKLFEDAHFVSNLGYRFTREKAHPDAYEDLYDGELYRSLSSPGKILGEKYNLSYTFNTDGFPVGGKSGKQSCWPIYLQINELPPQMRSKYMLLAGIYVGKKDPNMKIFMHPFVEEANVLSSTGVDWYLNGRPMNSKVIPLSACVDSPARAKLLNMTQFNGYYGCTVCYCRAEYSKKDGVRYTMPTRGLLERTHEEIILHAAQAHANMRLVRNKKKRSVKGVKGLSPIHTLNYLDLARGIRPDLMHSKLSGNGKHHTTIMHDRSGKEYYIGSDVTINLISKRLLSIKPPSSILRPPRSFKEIALWKASEWRSWVLFYGVVCLKDIVPEKYVVHFSMLSTALHIILQKSIRPEELERAHNLLLRYVFSYQDLFGKDAMVYNIHLLLHTKRDVECLGPAWTNTAFAFEGANKGLLELKKNYTNIALEMARKYLTFKSLPALTEMYGTSRNVLKFCERLSGRSLKKCQKVGSVLLVGSGYRCILDPEEFSTLQHSQGLSNREVMSYDRMVFNGSRYCVGSYGKSSFKHDDSYVCIQNECRGRIQKISCIYEENLKSIVIFVRELIVSDEPLFNDEYGRHCPIKKILGEGRLMAVRTGDISTQCVTMFLDYGSFICDMPYGCYGES